MICDMCGKDEKLFRTQIEKTELNVCLSCSMHGKKLGVAKSKQEKQADVQRMIEEREQPQSIEMVIPNAAKLIKQKRESMGITQEQFAKKINEKTSVIQNIEKGRSPNIILARKIGKMMHLELVTEYTESHKQIKIETKEATIGNMIKFKVRGKK